MAEKWKFPKAVDYKNLSDRAKSKLKVDGWWLQRKFDGCCLIVTVLKNNGVTFVFGESALGTKVESCGHILDEFKEMPAGVYACEAWSATGDFEDTSGLFRRRFASPGLSARLFDGAIKGQEDLGYLTRMDNIRAELALVNTMYTRVVAIGGTFYTWDQAWAYARSVQDSGNYDGAVLRNPYAPWVVGRSKGDIIKLKPLVDFDLTVLRVEKAVGGKTGRVTCALVCKWRNGEEQKVATGLDHDQQDNPEQFVGKVIRVAGMGLTNTGKIREPRFMGEREDTLPDY